MITALLLAACGDDGPEEPPVALAVSPASRTLEVGETVQLSALNASGAVSWASGNNAVASVVSTGFVTAVGAGTTTITATTANQSAAATITVNARPALALATSAVSFSARRGGADPAVQNVAVTNTGSGTLTDIRVVSVTHADVQMNAWLEAAQSGSTATPTTPAMLRLTVRLDTVPPGTYTAVVRISAANAENGPQDLTVTLTVAPAPRLEVSPAQIMLFSVAGDTTVRSNTSLITSDVAGVGLTGLTISRVDPSATWLTASLDRTFTTAVATLAATARSLAPGTYTTSVRVRSGSVTDNGPQDIDVVFTVAAPARLVVSSTSATFAADVGGANPMPQAIAITNGGDVQLDLSTPTVRYTGGGAQGWLTTVLSRLTAPATLTLQPLVGSLAPGQYSAEVELVAPGAIGSPAVIAVSFTVGEGPILELSNTALTFSAPENTTTPAQQIAVTNAGDGTLGSLTAAVEYAGASGWLNVALSDDAAPATLSATANTGALAPGTYTATIRVSSPDAQNSPRSVAVSLTVEPPVPVIALNAVSRSFTAPLGGGSPASQSVLVTNSGGGTLAGLATSVSYASGSGWLSASISPTSITTGTATLRLTAATGSLAAGSYSATVTVSSTVPDVVSRTVQVSFTVPPAVIGVSSNTVSYVRTSGTGSTGSAITISNLGAGTLSGLSVSVVGSSPWLSRALSATTVTTGTSSLTVTVNAGSGTASPLAPGDYVGTLRISSPVAGSVDITVNFDVPVSLTNNLMPSLQSTTCSGCHTWSSSTSFRNYVVNRSTTTRTPTFFLATVYPIRVVPGNAAGSYLTYQLQGTPGAWRMPTGGTLLSDTVRNYIRDWINQGAPNN